MVPRASLKTERLATTEPDDRQLDRHTARWKRKTDSEIGG